MKVLWSWLKELLPALEGVSAEEAAEALNEQGIEVASITQPSFTLGDKILVGKIVSVEQLTDKLKTAKIEINYSTFTAVSGAPNVREGVKVAVALPGSSFIDKNGHFVIAEQRTIKGIVSEAVLLSEREVGISDDHSGIWILPDDLETGLNLTELIRTWQQDLIIDLEITPNRGDALSHLGIARELRAWLRYHKNIDAEIVLPEIGKSGQNPLSVNIEIEDKEGCPRYTVVEINGVSIKPSSFDIQRKLRLLDFNIINNVVDAANYVMLEIGHPLHTFDKKEINDNAIKVRRAFPGESFKALNGNVYSLSEEDIVIADSKRVLALAGIIGAIDTGVQHDTTDIVLESAWFKPERISKTSRRLGLNTDASYRFERGADISITEFATRRFLKVLSEYENVSEIKDIYPSPKHPVQIFLSYEYMDKITGGFVSKEDAKRILELWDITVETGQEGFHCIVPLYKYDVTRPADLIEEIIRLYGMNNVPQTHSMNIQLVDTLKDERFFEYRDNVVKHFIKSGFQEIQTLSFIEKQWLSDYFNDNTIIEVLSSTIGSRNVLRPTMLFSLAEVVGRNRSNNVKVNQYVEVGKIYRKSDNSNIFNERWVCALVSHQIEPLKHWNQPLEASDYWRLAAHIEQFLSHHGLLGYWEEKDVPWLECSKQIVVDGQPVAIMGSIPYRIRKEFGIREHVFYGEINIDLIWNQWLSQKQQLLIGEFESAQLFWNDISFILPESISFGNFYKEILSRCIKEHSIYLSLIDVYKGKNIGENKVSYTIRLGSAHKKEINQVKNCITDIVVNLLGGTIRG